METIHWIMDAVGAAILAPTVQAIKKLIEKWTGVELPIIPFILAAGLAGGSIYLISLFLGLHLTTEEIIRETLPVALVAMGLHMGVKSYGEIKTILKKE